MASKSKTGQPAPPSAKSERSLSLEDTVAQKMRGVAKRTRNSASGYNPYDMAPKAPAPKTTDQKPTDLRKLSEWIRLTRQVASLKKTKPE
jgi:hypothetical protein